MTEHEPIAKSCEELEPVIGRAKPGTRMFRKAGSESEARFWYEAITKIAGPCVSPSGLNLYVPVSRSALHKRLHEGKLTAFYFDVVRADNQFTGLHGNKRKTAYCYMPVSECKAWRQEIAERLEKRGVISPDVDAQETPEWAKWFDDWIRKNGAPIKAD